MQRGIISDQVNYREIKDHAKIVMTKFEAEYLEREMETWEGEIEIVGGWWKGSNRRGSG